MAAAALVVSPAEAACREIKDGCATPGWFGRELRRFLSYPRLDKAYRLMRRGDLEGARNELDRALQSDPDNPALVVERLGIALREGDSPAVEGLATRMLSDPGYTPEQRKQARDLLADAALRHGRPQRVIDLLAESGESARDRLRLGYARMALGRSDEALEDFATAAARGQGEDRLAAFRALANAALAEDRADLADRAVEEGLAQAHGDADLLRLRAALAERRGDLAVAAQAFAASLDAHAPAIIWVRASRLLLAAGRPGEAADVARSGLLQATTDERPLLRAVMARAQLAVGDGTADPGPLPPDLALEWAADLAARGRHDDALVALGNVPGDEAHRRRAVLYERLDRPAKAAAELAQLSTLSPEIHARRAMLLDRAHDPSGAVTALRRAIQAAPTLERRLQLAEFESRRGNVVVALRELESLAEGLPARSPARLDVLMRLGHLAAAAKQPEPAARAFTAAFRESGRDDAAAAAAQALLAIGRAAPAVALESSPDILDQAAELQAGRGELAESVLTLELLAEKSPLKSPRRIQALTRLGYRALAASQPARAAQAFRAAYDEVPGGDPKLMQAAAYAWQRAGQLDEAAAFLRAIPAGAPHGAQARRLLAELMLDAGRRDDAVAALSGLAAEGAALPRDLLQLGFLLRQGGDCPAAVPVLADAAKWGAGPVARLTQAMCLKDMANDAAALALLEGMEIPAKWEAGTRQTAHETRAVLLAKAERHAEAAAAWAAARAAGGPPRMAIWQAHSLRRAGRLDEAAGVLGGVESGLAASDRILFLDESGELALARNDLAAAAIALREAVELAPEPRRHLAWARLAERMGDLGQADRAFRQAGPEAELELAYFYRRHDRDAEAVPLLENAVLLSPDPRLHEELGYTLKRMGQPARSAHSFRAALDQMAAEADPGRAYRLRREVVEMERAVSGSVYIGYDGRDAIGVANPVSRARGNSVLGGELAWRVPGVSVEDPNRLQLYAGAYMANTDGEMPEAETAQLQVGLRFKPLADFNLVLSAGRMVALGDDALDGWMVGAGYSFADRAALDPERRIANYTALDVGASYVFGTDQGFYANAELIQGASFRVSETSVVVPHVVIAGQYLDENDGSASRVAIGPGIRYSLWPDEDKHRAGAVAIDLDLQYRFDVAGSRQEGSGPFARLSIRF